MTKQPKRGRPRKPGKVVFNFRMPSDLRQRLIESAHKAGHSSTEEAELRLRRDFGWEETKNEIEEIKQRALAWESAARIKAIRLAGLQILREVDGRPTRVIVDVESLLAEADGIARGSRSGFVDPHAPPAVSAQLPMTKEEADRLQAQIDELKRDLAAAKERLAAEDAEAAAAAETVRPARKKATAQKRAAG